MNDARIDARKDGRALAPIEIELRERGSRPRQDRSERKAEAFGGDGCDQCRLVVAAAAGTLGVASTDAVNGSQLYATNQNVAQNTTDIATKGGQYDIMTIGTYEVPIWAKQGWLLPLENLGGGFVRDSSGKITNAGKYTGFGHTDYQQIVAEIKQFALEVLSRSSLSYEDYEKIRRALSEPSHRLSTRLEDVPSTTREPRS